MVAGEVGRGVSLSVAMGKAPAVFDAPYRALVSTGEEAGALPVCLERYQNYVDLRQKTGAQVSKAMVYPIALLVTLSAVLTFLFIAVIPNFVSMYRELGSTLPMPTQVLMAVEERFPVIALGIAGMLATVWLLDRLWTSKPEGAIARDKALLSIPVLGHFRRASAAAATARMLSILTSSGATVTRALAVASSTAGDRYFAHVLGLANRAVKEGNPLAEALREGGLFRPMALKMIQAGEASGSLDKMLAAVAAQQDEELAEQLEQAHKLDGARGASLCRRSRRRRRHRDVSANLHFDGPYQVKRNPVDRFAKDPLTLSLSPPARLGELASQRGRIRKRMRLGERTLELPLRVVRRPFSPSAPACGCGSKRCKHAKACLRGEGQDEGGLREPIARSWHDPGNRRQIRLAVRRSRRGVRIPPEALERLPAADARRLGVAPLWARGNVLAVATSRPDDFELEQRLGVLCRSEIEFVISPAERNRGAAQEMRRRRQSP